MLMEQYNEYCTLDYAVTHVFGWDTVRSSALAQRVGRNLTCCLKFLCLKRGSRMKAGRCRIVAKSNVDLCNVQVERLPTLFESFTTFAVRAICQNDVTTS